MDACSHGMMTKVIFLGICIVVVVVGDGVGIADFERLGFCFPRAATSGSRELLRRVQGQGPGYVVTAECIFPGFHSKKIVPGKSMKEPN